ncbi:TadE/TadG family type IV pilus assembly protein [Candidatus Pantoea multigeneris]|uniref:Uncharacterized protein n=1 Tax=Candidatus Pantoea multigeneris TaxID=2608357 RepID=A0ABX0R802_9GAMM|nr:hypothetical protein [Pantoea multigeneris]NIF21502.1 hypothetical protein [Pantoea multigeneris]
MKSNGGLRRFLRQQRGVVAVETVLAFPILLAAGLLIADLLTVVLEREHMEQRAGAVSSVLAMQTNLTQQGLTGLISATLPENGGGNYQLTITNVKQTGEVYWQLNRGTATGLCADSDLAPGSSWPGSDLPEIDAKNGSESVSLIVVQLCRQSSDLKLTTGLGLNPLLTASAVGRVTEGTLTLDTDLANEAGVKNDTNEN